MKKTVQMALTSAVLTAIASQGAIAVPRSTCRMGKMRWNCKSRQE